jgi:hypothetical protein
MHLGRGLVTVGPMLTLGFLTFVFIGVYAVARHSKALGWSALGYFLLLVALAASVGTGGENEDLAWWRDTIGVLTWGASFVVGTAHLAAVVHAPERGAQRAQTTETLR